MFGANNGVWWTKVYQTIVSGVHSDRAAVGKTTEPVDTHSSTDISQLIGLRQSQRKLHL